MFLHDGLINVGNNVLKSLFSTPFVNRYFAFKYNISNKVRTFKLSFVCSKSKIDGVWCCIILQAQDDGAITLDHIT